MNGGDTLGERLSDPCGFQIPRIHRLQPPGRELGEMATKSARDLSSALSPGRNETAVGSIPRRLTPVFRDRSELPSAADLGRVVNEALDGSANLIVICSPRSAASNYVNEEISTFKHLGRADRIFCLVVDGEPNASDLAGREARSALHRRCVVSSVEREYRRKSALRRLPRTPAPARTAGQTPN